MSEFDDPFGLHRESVPSGRVDYEDREIRLLGQPILAWNPATNDRCVPEEYRQHELVAGRYFYTLPNNVLDAVVEEVGEDRFDADLLAMERQLSAICGDHTSNVGFWQNIALSYREFRPMPIAQFPDKSVQDVGLNPAAVSHALRVYQERDKGPLERFSRGYCGWLMTNCLFLDEHDALLASHAETVSRWGTPHAATFLPADYRAKLLPGTDPNSDPLWSAFMEDCNPFLLRWRLSGLAGPYLPIPVKLLLAGTFPISVLQQLMDVGGVFILPDTMPIPSRDQLRGALDNALHRGERQDHLEEWLGIVRANNPAKNQMDPFARYFELQHYWRILHQRHPSAVHKNIGRLQSAFDGVFELSSARTRADLKEIREKLGEKWLDRPCPIASVERAPSTRSKPR